MSKSLNSAEAVQYDTTLVLEIELSSKSWVLAAQVPDMPKTKAKRTIEPDKLANRTSWLFSPRSTDIGLVPLPPAAQSIGWLRHTKQDGPGSGWRDG